MSNVNFNFYGKEVNIQCKNKDLLKDICDMYAFKINFDVNKLLFLYGGDILNKNLSFEKHANSIDQKRKQMNIIVYEIDKYYKEELLQNKGIDINNLKEKLKFILSKYLETRVYIEKKVDNWRDAILKECEPVFLNFKEYKTFINLTIYNNELKNADHYQTWNTISGKDTIIFDVYFKSEKIVANLNINMFTKNKNRTKMI